MARARRREAAARRAGAARRPAHDRQPGQAQRARPRHPRRARRRAAAARGALPADHRRRQGLLRRLRHRRAAAGTDFAQAAEAIVAHPFTAAIEALDAYPFPVLAGAQRPRDRRRAGAGALVRPARLQRRRAARHAAGAARPRLLAHRAAQVPRRDRRAAHARAVLHRAQRRRAARRSAGASSARSCPRDEVAARGVELAAEIAANAPLSLVGNKRVIRALLAARGRARTRGRGGARRAARRRASARRTSARACARSRRSARRAGRVVKDARATMEGCARLVARSSWRCRLGRRPAAHAMPARRPPRRRRAGRRPADRRGAPRARSASRSPAGWSTASSSPPRARDFWTYDWGLRASPNRPWRRWGTDRLVRTRARRARGYRARATRTRRASGIADLSRTARRPLRQELRRARPRVAPERARRRHPLPAASTGSSGGAWAPRLVDEALSQDARRPLRRRRRGLRVHRPGAWTCAGRAGSS